MPKLAKKYVAVNEHGRRIGQDHPKAELTDHEVDLLIALHEEFPLGHPEHKGYRWLGRKFGISRSHARKIVKGQRRCQTAARFKAV